MTAMDVQMQIWRSSLDLWRRMYDLQVATAMGIIDVTSAWTWRAAAAVREVAEVEQDLADEVVAAATKAIRKAEIAGAPSGAAGFVADETVAGVGTGAAAKAVEAGVDLATATLDAAVEATSEMTAAAVEATSGAVDAATEAAPEAAAEVAALVVEATPTKRRAAPARRVAPRSAAIPRARRPRS